MYFLISYSVPQRTLHWADHQNAGSRSLQKPYFGLGVYGLCGEFQRLADSFMTMTEFLIISLGIYVEMTFLVQKLKKLESFSTLPRDYYKKITTYKAVFSAGL